MLDSDGTERHTAFENTSWRELMKKISNYIWLAVTAAAVLFAVSAMGCQSADAGETSTPEITKDQCAVTMKVTGMT